MPSIRNDSGGINTGLRPAPEPTRTQDVFSVEDNTVPLITEGTQHSPHHGSRVGLWINRYTHWHESFEEEIGPSYRKYWEVYRAFDNQPLPGPAESWRDRTIIPEAFKIVENRVPRTVVPMWGGREYFQVHVRDGRDRQYELKVRELIRATLEEIGEGTKEKNFFARMVDAGRYREVCGHVWLKVYWRTQADWRKTKEKNVSTGKWEDIEVYETVFDGVDIQWLPLDSIAADLSGANRWRIEMLQTTVENLEADNAAHQALTGEPLYDETDLLILKMDHAMAGHTGSAAEQPQEPRDTEGWPQSGEARGWTDGSSTPVQLWLCWDNVERTLTKIANRSVVLAHGASPTPRGLDPYISVPCIPIPNRFYGESYLHYVGPLAAYQTRIARARADEVLINIWQQYAIRAGVITDDALFFAPGGAMELELQPDQSIQDSIQVIPRRPVMPEAYTEENYRQTQAESVAGTDPVSQGVEATKKSRDVTATEIQRRSIGEATRYQLENFYLEEVWKKPLLQAVYDLLQQNLTQPKMVQVLGQGQAVDLTQLDRPIQIMVGGGIREWTSAERQEQTQQLLALAGQPAFARYLRAPELLRRLLQEHDWDDIESLIKTEKEVQAELAAQARQMAQKEAPARTNQASQQTPDLPRLLGGSGGNGVGSGTSEPTPEGPQTQSVDI